MGLFGFRGALQQMANCGNGDYENGHDRLPELPHQSVLAFTYEFPTYRSRISLLQTPSFGEVAFAKVHVRVWKIGEKKG